MHINLIRLGRHFSVFAQPGFDWESCEFPVPRQHEAFAVVFPGCRHEWLDPEDLYDLGGEFGTLRVTDANGFSTRLGPYISDPAQSWGVETSPQGVRLALA